MKCGANFSSPLPRELHAGLADLISFYKLRTPGSMGCKISPSPRVGGGEREEIDGQNMFHFDQKEAASGAALPYHSLAFRVVVVLRFHCNTM
jgi:hypothetical protein